ncbi:MAG: hypothetical protein NDF54_08145, partial [archaeon GB-1867-035]|nr:hypothetical protein [Candidatus Culexmicrobium profundum]
RDIDGNWVVDTPNIFLRIDSSNGKVLFFSTNKEGDNLSATLTSDYNLYYPEYEVGSNPYTPFLTGTVTIEKIDDSHLRVVWDSEYQQVTVIYEFYVDKKYFKKTIQRIVKSSAIFANAQYALMFSNIINDGGYYNYDLQDFISSYVGYPDSEQSVNPGIGYGWNKTAMYLSGGGYYLGLIAIPIDNDEYNVLTWRGVTKLTDNNEWEVQVDFFHGYDRDGIYLESGRQYGVDIYIIVTNSQSELQQLLELLKPPLESVVGLKRACENIRELTGDYGIFAITNTFGITQLLQSTKIIYKPLFNKGGYLDLGINVSRTAVDYGHSDDFTYAWCEYNNGDKVEVYIENDNLRIRYNSSLNMSVIFYSMTLKDSYYEINTDQGIFYIIVNKGQINGNTIDPDPSTGLVEILITDNYGQVPVTPTVYQPTQLLYQILSLMIVTIIIILLIELITSMIKSIEK